jgi:hypothetical protein
MARLGQPIPSWGDRLVTLKFQVQDFSWKFLLADVAFPISGVDFLRAHKLLIDPEGHALLDSTGRRLAGQLLRSPSTATVVIGLCSRTNRWRSPLLLQPTPPEQLVPEQQAPEQPTPEQPAPEQPAPDQFLLPVSGQPRRRWT